MGLKSGLVGLVGLVGFLSGNGFAMMRSPCSSNIKHENKAPVFYTSMTKIQLLYGRADIVKRKNKAMDERFTIREWNTVLLLHARKPDFPKCAKCFASFVLDNDAAWHSVGTFV